MSPCVRAFEPSCPRLAGVVFLVAAEGVWSSHQRLCGTSASLQGRLKLVLGFGWRVRSASRLSWSSERGLGEIVGSSDDENILFTSSPLPGQQHEIEHHPLLFLNVVHVFQVISDVNFTVLYPADAENRVILTNSVEIQTFYYFINFSLDFMMIFNFVTLHRFDLWRASPLQGSVDIRQVM